MNNSDFVKVNAENRKNNADSDPCMSDCENQLRNLGIESAEETAESHYTQRKQIVPVAAALIWDNNKFMICQRPKNKTRALLWEFVGGKVESGETKEQALIRECREELAITVAVDDVFMDVVHEYPDITVHLTLFNAAIAEGAPKKLEHNDLKWITPSEIPQYEFCPADEEILKKITEVYNG